MSAWTADQCITASGRELSAEREKLRGALVDDPKEREFAARKKCKVFEPGCVGTASGAIAHTRWVLTRKMVGRVKSAWALSAARGYQGPYLKDGSVETPGRVSVRSSGFVREV